jgi:hypothetical protein
MTTFITVYHSRVIVNNEIDSYEFVRMKNDLFNARAVRLDR